MEGTFFGLHSVIDQLENNYRKPGDVSVDLLCTLGLLSDFSSMVRFHLISTRMQPPFGAISVQECASWELEEAAFVRDA